MPKRELDHSTKFTLFTIQGHSSELPSQVWVLQREFVSSHSSNVFIIGIYNLSPIADHLCTMIFLKWNHLNRNSSGCVYHRYFIDIASESPRITVYATFFTFWVAAINGTNADFFLLPFPRFLTRALTTPFPALTTPFEDLTIFRVSHYPIWASYHPF